MVYWANKGNECSFVVSHCSYHNNLTAFVGVLGTEKTEIIDFTYDIAVGDPAS